MEFSMHDPQSKKGDFLELAPWKKSITAKLYIRFQKKCKPLPAWATTNHKFQGSQTDTVVYFVSANDNRQHIYTAMTKAKKQVHIIGE